MTVYVCDIEWYVSVRIRGSVVLTSIRNEPGYPGIVDSVCVTGTFDNWSCSSTAGLVDDKFVQRITLTEPEEILFKYVINGCDWCVSDKYEIVHDDKGNSNNRLGPEALIEKSEENDPQRSRLMLNDYVSCDKLEVNITPVSDFAQIQEGLDTNIVEQGAGLKQGETVPQSHTPDVGKHLLNFEPTNPDTQRNVETFRTPKFDTDIVPSVSDVAVDPIISEANVELSTEPAPVTVVPQVVEIKRGDVNVNQPEDFDADPIGEDHDELKALGDEITARSTALKGQNLPSFKDKINDAPEESLLSENYGNHGTPPPDSGSSASTESRDNRGSTSLVDIALGDPPHDSSKTHSASLSLEVRNKSPLPKLDSVLASEAQPQLEDHETQFGDSLNVRSLVDIGLKEIGPETAKLPKHSIEPELESAKVNPTQNAASDVGPFSDRPTTSRSSAKVHDDGDTEVGTEVPAGGNEKGTNVTDDTKAPATQNVRSLVDIALASEDNERALDAASKDAEKSDRTGLDDAPASKLHDTAPSDREGTVEEDESHSATESKARDPQVLIDAPLKGRLVSDTADNDTATGGKETGSSEEVEILESEPNVEIIEAPVEAVYIGFSEPTIASISPGESDFSQGLIGKCPKPGSVSEPIETPEEGFGETELIGEYIGESEHDQDMTGEENVVPPTPGPDELPDEADRNIDLIKESFPSNESGPSSGSLGESRGLASGAEPIESPVVAVRGINLVGDSFSLSESDRDQELFARSNDNLPVANPIESLAHSVCEIDLAGDSDSPQNSDHDQKSLQEGTEFKSGAAPIESPVVAVRETYSVGDSFVPGGIGHDQELFGTSNEFSFGADPKESTGESAQLGFAEPAVASNLPEEADHVPESFGEDYDAESDKVPERFDGDFGAETDHVPERFGEDYEAFAPGAEPLDSPVGAAILAFAEAELIGESMPPVESDHAEGSFGQERQLGSSAEPLESPVGAAMFALAEAELICESIRDQGLYGEGIEALIVPEESDPEQELIGKTAEPPAEAEGIPNVEPIGNSTLPQDRELKEAVFGEDELLEATAEPHELPAEAVYLAFSETGLIGDPNQPIDSDQDQALFEKENAPLPVSRQIDDQHVGSYFARSPGAQANRFSPPSPKLVFPSLQHFIPLDPRARNSFLKQGTPGWKDVGPLTEPDLDLDEQNAVESERGPCQSSGSFAAVSIPTTSEDYNELVRAILSGSSHDEQFATPGGSIYSPNHQEDSDDEEGDGDGDGDTLDRAGLPTQAGRKSKPARHAGHERESGSKPSFVHRVINAFKS